MQISDTLDCDFYDSHDWNGREMSHVEIRNTEKGIQLEFVTKKIDKNRDTEEITELKLDQVDRRIVHRIHSKLGDWLQDTSSEGLSLTTPPLQGTYQTSSKETDVRHLQVDISNEGFRILGTTPEDAPVENAIRIPSTHEIQMDESTEISQFEHLKRLYSIFEIFLAATDNPHDDIIETSRYLLNPDTHLHPSLQSDCRSRFDSEDHTGVVQAAGTALEEKLEDVLPDSAVTEAPNTSDLASRAFRPTDPLCRWGYDDGEQEGLMYLYRGAMQALRNPTSHPRGDPSRNRFLDDINGQDSIDIMCLFNFLIRRLEIYGTQELERVDS